ncbi:MAG: esterase family protein [Pyrinomonadaceae bacterium]|nr:esterase family protein [Pyrinomonadaceae bacterium]
MKKQIVYTVFVGLFLSVQFASAQAKGTVKIDKIVSAALAKNVTGENPEREITIYLPPGYFSSTKRYPVLYLLHGTGDDHLNFIDDSEKESTIQYLMDTGIAARRFGEMIIVTPNEKTNWQGSFYVNSSATGNWEDFTADELVKFIDKNYRTIARAESRAIAGHSMGGFGAMTLAMKHPDIFSVVYAMNSGFLSFTAELDSKNPDVKKFVTAKNIEEILATDNRNIAGMLMVSQAFSPNPSKPPFYADKPYLLKGNKLVPNPAAYQKWLENDVVKMAEKYKENLLKLRGIKFDCGNEEDIKLIEINSILLSKKLTILRVPHQFEQYNGDHRNRLWGLKGRIYNELLPFIFDNIEK